MKSLVIAAALLTSASALAQPPQDQPAPGETMQPDTAPTPPADPLPRESGMESAPPVTPGPAPSGPVPPTPQYTTTAAPAAPPVTFGTLPPPRQADENYPACSRTVTDNCVQRGPR